ncbi:MAG: hypothetical protein AYK18_02620 [Theionarchaea archaeon DG-70]|nr:MAG: hypothetical protein AYK18_02620 [Theionarchaea archaeon DG-70]
MHKKIMDHKIGILLIVPLFLISLYSPYQQYSLHQNQTPTEYIMNARLLLELGRCRTLNESYSTNPVQELTRNSLIIHENAWEKVIQEAQKDQYHKYGIYITRTLAVTHPEVYLQADRLFAATITTHTGFQKAYNIKDVLDSYLFGRDFEGPPFSFDDVDFAGYTIVKARNYYPEGYPVLPFCDRRLLPIASTLKSAQNQITQLELGVQYYCAHEGNGYLIYCENENTYYADGNTLTWMKTVKSVEEIEGNPVLIFSEHSVWYPLMERDDTGTDQFLRTIVEMYATEVTTPHLEEVEKSLHKELIQVTQLSSFEKDIITIATLRPSWNFDLYVDSDSFKTAEKAGIDFTAENRPFLKCANYLSPITSYLAAVAEKYVGKEKIRELTEEYLTYTCHARYMAYGHTWFRDFVEQTAEESYTTTAGYCIVQASNISAALDLAHIDHYWIQAFSTSGGHDWLYIPEFDVIVSNGLMFSAHNSILCYSEEEGSYNLIDFVGFRNEWVYFKDLKLRGTIPPEDFVEMLKELEGFHEDTLLVLKGYDGVPLEDFIEVLQEQKIVREYLEKGWKEKEDGELQTAFYHLYEAYTMAAVVYDHTDIIYEKEGLTITVLDLEKDLVFLCLHFIKSGDEATKEERYQDALQNFAVVNLCWRAFYSYSAFFVDSPEYQEYGEAGTIYTPGEIEEKIKECTAHLVTEAEELKEKGDLGESKEKYDFLIATLVEADWPYQEDIQKLESAKSDVEAEIARKQLLLMVSLIGGLIGGVLVIIKYKVKRKFK